MKTTYPKLVFFFVALFIVNCSSSTGSEETPPEEDYQWKQTHTIEEFISEFGDLEVTIDTVAITGIVLSSDEEKNINNTIYFGDETGAVALSIEGSNLFQTYPIGEEVLLKAIGLKLNTDTRTITLANNEAIHFDGSEAELIKTGTSQTVSPTYINPSNLAVEQLNFYYRFVGFQFEEDVVGESYILNSEQTLRTVIDQNGTELTLSFNPNATFADETISTKAGSIYGILTLVDNEYIVKIVSFDDLQFTSERRPPFEKKTFEFSGNLLPYQIMYPRDYSSNSEYPLVVFLHGAGERGNNNTSQMAYGTDTFGSFNSRTDYPAIVIFPQCPSDVMWSRRIKYTNDNDSLIFEFPVEEEPNYAMEMVIELVRKLKVEEAVDENRIYITGLSMGGIGTLEFAYYAPDLPAVAATIAGGHDSTLVKDYAQKIDFQLYHGNNDGVVPARYSEQIYLKLDELGFNADYFEADGRGHEWNYVLDDPDYLSRIFGVVKEN